ncbi:hypothetical protein DENSPDRAFT_852336 [Dentipellis sp. KUC8613]|nr:hypothetical protein DENSPDRAFT_852336 [Dentipellis sp. KUC8613]
MFGSPGVTSHESCLVAQRRLPCSSCLESEAAFISLAKATMKSPPLSPSHSQPHPTNTSASSTNIDQDGDDSFDTGIHRTPLTKPMQLEAQDELRKFFRLSYLARRPQTPKDLYSPSVCYMPSSMQLAILNHFHLIRDREALAGLLSDWEYLEQDGNKLFNNIKRLNAKFDTQHEERKKAAAKKAATTRKRKADEKAASEAAENLAGGTIDGVALSFDVLNIEGRERAPLRPRKRLRLASQAADASDSSSDENYNPCGRGEAATSQIHNARSPNRMRRSVSRRP